MKYLVTLISLILPLVTLAVTNSKLGHSKEAIFISATTIEAEARLIHDHYICLGTGWDKSHPEIHQKMVMLKTKHPDLFISLDHEKQNCFAPMQTSYDIKREIDLMLRVLERKAQDQIYTLVQPDGNLVQNQSPDLQASLKAFNSLQPLNPLDCDNEFKFRNQDETLLKKIRRAEAFVGGMELAGMGILIALPKSITKWNDGWMKDAQNNLKRAWTSAPVWDKDEWTINYIGHPLAGAAYYNMLRSQGATPLQSFIFSTVQSTFWEYVIEAIAEQPSTQDLFITPIIGSIVGELSHLATNRMRRNGFTTLEKIAVTIINPAYVINNGFRIK